MSKTGYVVLFTVKTKVTVRSSVDFTVSLVVIANVRKKEIFTIFSHILGFMYHVEKVLAWTLGWGVASEIEILFYFCTFCSVWLENVFNALLK